MKAWPTTFWASYRVARFWGRGLISIRNDWDLNRAIHAIQILYKCLIFFVSIWVNLPWGMQSS